VTSTCVSRVKETPSEVEMLIGLECMNSNDRVMMKMIANRVGLHVVLGMSSVLPTFRVLTLSEVRNGEDMAGYEP